MIKTLGQGLASAFSLIIVPEILHDEILDICCLFLSSLHKDVYEIWIFVFSCVVSSTNLEEIIEKSVNFVINLSDFNQKSIFRQISCKLLLVLANKLKSEFEGGLFVRARALSQDTDSEVRLEMCLTWVSICSFKAQTDIQEIIFLELQKLIEDEVKLVKAESIVCLIKIIPLFTKEFIQNNVIKLVKHHIFNDISIEIQLKISEYIGELLTNIKDHISNPIREIIIKSLVGLQDGDLTVKKNLVSNLPTIFSVLGSCENLKDMLIKLANDEETSIQVLLASKLHEINKSDYYCQIISYISQKFLETSETYGNIIRNLSW